MSPCSNARRATRPSPTSPARNQYDQALNKHSRLLEALRDRGAITHGELLDLELVAGDVHTETLVSLGARLKRLRPELADRIEVAMGESGHPWYAFRQYGESGFQGSDV